MSKRFGHRRLPATERLYRQLPDLAKLRQKAYSSLVLMMMTLVVTFHGFALQWWVRDWPQASAVGLEAELVTVSSYRGGSSHEIRLRYRYLVDGRTYEGTTFRWLNAGIDPDSFPLYQRDYGAGARFLVFYDPGNPANAFVRRPIAGNLFFYIMAGINAIIMFYSFNEYITTRAIYRIRRPELFEPEQPQPSGPRSARAIKRRQRRSRR